MHRHETHGIDWPNTGVDLGGRDLESGDLCCVQGVLYHRCQVGPPRCVPLALRAHATEDLEQFAIVPLDLRVGPRRVREGDVVLEPERLAQVRLVNRSLPLPLARSLACDRASE